MELTTKQKAAFGIGAVGKDMVYALSASYVMYYYQDVLGLPATFVGLILMIARVFDAFNDPFMGVLVAKTRTRWGRFRPWILSGTILNAAVLYALFAAPVLEGADMMVYFSVIYILWGRHLHDDGHSLLVYDPRCDPHPGRPRKPVGRRPHLCGRRSALIAMVYHRCWLVL